MLTRKPNQGCELSWHRVQHFPLNMNLAPLMLELQRHQVVYRITEEANGQCLWVADETQIEPLRQWLRNVDFSDAAFQGSFNSGIDVAGSASHSTLGLLSLANRFPVTLIAIALAVVGYLAMEFQWLWLIQWLTFQPLELTGKGLGWGSVSEAFQSGQFWRLLTPVFLHFSVLHLVFNSLWVWEFGRRIEFYCGMGSYLNVLLITGIFSNVVQYFWSGPALFGGLSGVVYGLLGFVWVMQKRAPGGPLQIQPAIFGFLLFWLALGFSGALNVFIDGSVANGAHAAGLVSGLVLGYFWRLPDVRNRI